MATEISNGRQTVKLYSSVNRGKAIYQLAYYFGGKRVQKNFADKAEAKRTLTVERLIFITKRFALSGTSLKRSDLKNVAASRVLTR